MTGVKKILLKVLVLNWASLLCSSIYTFLHVFHEQHWWFKNVPHGACHLFSAWYSENSSMHRLERRVVPAWVQGCSNSGF